MKTARFPGTTGQTCHHRLAPALPPQKAAINLYLWCAAGAVLGFLLAVMSGKSDKILYVEAIAVGVFGASVGGELIADFIKGPANQGIGMRLLFAVATAAAALFLLVVMRRAVGPMKAGKSKAGTRR